MKSIKTSVECMRKKKYNYSKGELNKGDTIMRVAICDDESIIRARLLEAINDSSAVGDLEIAEYSNGYDLIYNHIIGFHPFPSAPFRSWKGGRLWI